MLIRTEPAVHTAICSQNIAMSGSPALGHARHSLSRIFGVDVEEKLVRESYAARLGMLLSNLGILSMIRHISTLCRHSTKEIL